jgi:hypothetical protein
MDHLSTHAVHPWIETAPTQLTQASHRSQHGPVVAGGRRVGGHRARISWLLLAVGAEGTPENLATVRDSLHAGARRARSRKDGRAGSPSVQPRALLFWP